MSVGCTYLSYSNKAIEGLQKYYYNTQGFWDMCGQTGYNCKCETFGRCYNCYRWSTAVVLDNLIVYDSITGEQTFKPLCDAILKRTPYVASPISGFVDDHFWYVLAYIRAYEYYGDQSYLDYSKKIYSAMKNSSSRYNGCGGWAWNWGLNISFTPNSISSGLALIASSKLALLSSNNDKEEYRQTALDTYNFIIRNFIGTSGRFQGLIVNGITDKNLTCCSPSCTPDNLNGYSYNQGAFIRGCTWLYKLTNDTQYLDKAGQVLQQSLKVYAPSGILTSIFSMPNQDYPLTPCEGGNDPGGNILDFKGIFALYIVDYLQVRPDQDALKVINTTTDAIWNNARIQASPSSTNLDVNNVCFGKSEPVVDSETPKFSFIWDKKFDPAVKYCSDSRTQTTALSGLLTGAILNGGSKSCSLSPLPPIPPIQYLGRWRRVLYILLIIIVISLFLRWIIAKFFHNKNA